MIDVLDFLGRVATIAIGAYIGFIARWYTIEKPEQQRMKKREQERELRKLDEVKQAAREGRE